VEKNELLKERETEGREKKRGKVSRAKATLLIGIKGEKFPRRAN